MAASVLPPMELFTEADKFFGGTQAEGKYLSKDAYEQMEFALNLYMLKNWAGDLTGKVPQSFMIEQFEKAQALLPTQSKRDDEQQKLQQFSTPHTHGSIAAWVLNITGNDTVLEPTVGNGNLATQALLWAPDKVYGNELSTRRAELVKQLPGVTDVFTENAEHLNDLLPADVKPTVVIMNPPFSNSANTSKTKNLLQGGNHVDQALRRMEEGGRLVAILGRGMELDRAKTGGWWQKTMDKYNVRAVIRVDGKEYSKFGTNFDNVIAVIDKTGKTEQPPIRGNVAKVEELIPLLQEIRDDRQHSGTEQKADQPVQQNNTGKNEGNTGSQSSVLPPAGRTGTTQGFWWHFLFLFRQRTGFTTF